MKKHAFLIIAHTGEEDLINLIKSVDFEYNDIFIHVDKKWKDCDFSKIQAAAKHSSVIFSPRRLSVIWGGVSQIKVELLLIELALQKGDYGYLHLLSGQDICIKSPSRLHEFFDANEGREFLCYCGGDWQKSARDRVKYYHLNCGRNKLKLKLDKLYVGIQKLFRVNRLKKSDFVFCGGSNWASITSDFARYLVSNKERIFKTFSHTFCADELYKHTYAFNSEYKNNIYLLNTAEKNDDTDPDMYRANMRYIDWVRGNPYLFTEDDFETIKSSPYMFIRKVSYSNGLPRMILENCIEEQSIQ